MSIALICWFVASILFVALLGRTARRLPQDKSDAGR